MTDNHETHQSGSPVRHLVGRCLCFFGIHSWGYSRPLNAGDWFPFASFPYEEPKRVCVRCECHQRWLPGYGGSSLGDWIGDKSTDAPEFKR
jgi:hypothetical protein